MIINPDVLAAHAEFGGDLESMQKLYDWPNMKLALEVILSSEGLTALELRAIAKDALRRSGSAAHRPSPPTRADAHPTSENGAP